MGGRLKITADQARAVARSLKFRDGLVTAVVRDFRTKDVLMVAMQDEQAVVRTLTTGLMHYWSRSRRKLWLKGEESKHYQYVRGLWVDCDGDTLLFDVEQEGGACHEGYRSCFYRKLEDGKFVKVLDRIFDPKKIYRRMEAK